MTDTKVVSNTQKCQQKQQEYLQIQGKRQAKYNKNLNQFYCKPYHSKSCSSKFNMESGQDPGGYKNTQYLKQDNKVQKLCHFYKQERSSRSNKREIINVRQSQKLKNGHRQIQYEKQKSKQKKRVELRIIKKNVNTHQQQIKNKTVKQNNKIYKFRNQNTRDYLSINFKKAQQLSQSIKSINLKQACEHKQLESKSNLRNFSKSLYCRPEQTKQKFYHRNIQSQAEHQQEEDDSGQQQNSHKRVWESEDDHDYQYEWNDEFDSKITMKKKGMINNMQQYQHQELKCMLRQLAGNHKQILSMLKKIVYTDDHINQNSHQHNSICTNNYRPKLSANNVNLGRHARNQSNRSIKDQNLNRNGEENQSRRKNKLTSLDKTNCDNCNKPNRLKINKAYNEQIKVEGGIKMSENSNSNNSSENSQKNQLKQQRSKEDTVRNVSGSKNKCNNKDIHNQLQVSNNLGDHTQANNSKYNGSNYSNGRVLRCNSTMDKNYQRQKDIDGDSQLILPQYVSQIIQKFLNKNNINNNISINIHNPNPNSNNYHPGIANSDHNNQDDAHNSSIVINGSPKNFKNKPNEVKKSRTHLEQLIELRQLISRRFQAYSYTYSYFMQKLVSLSTQTLSLQQFNVILIDKPFLLTPEQILLVNDIVIDNSYSLSNSKIGSNNHTKTISNLCPSKTKILKQKSSMSVYPRGDCCISISSLCQKMRYFVQDREIYSKNFIKMRMLQYKSLLKNKAFIKQLSQCLKLVSHSKNEIQFKKLQRVLKQNKVQEIQTDMIIGRLCTLSTNINCLRYQRIFDHQWLDDHEPYFNIQ